MIIVLGATGHVGSAVADELLRSGENVTVVVRDRSKSEGWQAKGTKVAVADVRDVDALRNLLRTGKRAFLLDPPAPVAGDTDVEERQTASAIVEALDGSGLEMVVTQSTYGSQPGKGKGDLSVLYEFEEALAAQPIPGSVLRAAYYMSNWDPFLDVVRQGTLPTMFPADLRIPMVAPADLGAVAAQLLRKPVEQDRVHYVEGPARYSSRDVAEAFGRALRRSVDVVVTPREKWNEAFRDFGFSKEAASSYTGMTAVTVDGGIDMPPDPERGAISLTEYVERLVEHADGAAAST